MAQVFGRQIPYTSPIPADIRGEIEGYAEEFEGLIAADAERLDRAATYRREIEAVRDPRLQAETWDYGRKVRDKGVLARHNIQLPFAQALTVKHAYRVAGRLPDINVPRRDSSELERARSSTMEKICWALVGESNGEQQFASGGWEASQIGAACFDAYFDVRRQMPVFREIDPASTLVVRGLNDPHDFEVVYRFWDVPVRTAKAHYGDVLFRGLESWSNAIEPTYRTGKHEMVRLVDRTDRFKRTRFALGGRVPLEEEIHDYGFCNYVVIPNLGPERDIWGWSDYEFVRDLCGYLGYLFSREADVIRATAGGAYLATAVGQDPAVIKEVIQNGGILPGKEGGQVLPIPGPEMPDFLPSHVESGLRYLQMLGFSPPAAWGDGSAGSGSDRNLQLQPQLELTALKQINWASGLSRLFDRMLRMIELKLVSPATYSGQVTSMGFYRHSPFSLILEPEATDSPDFQAISDDIELEALVPRTPQELFKGDYRVDFTWANRIDPDDPAFVTTEVNKFVQGVQSLQTTLERLGHKAPEDEMKLIADEAEKYPWLRSGMIALLKAQGVGAGQGEGGGAPVDPASAMSGALETIIGSGTQATDLDAAIGGLPGESGVGVPFGGA
jgi:hypothetical protein